MLLPLLQDAPWTLQRLAELLLEPRKQYSRLHKLAAAVERLLTVTTEVRPALAEQTPVLLAGGQAGQQPVQ